MIELTPENLSEKIIAYTNSDLIYKRGTSISINSSNFSEEIIAKVIERFSKAPIVQHKCHNCGATVEMDVDKHIFICRYCGSAYAIGTAHVNDFL